MSNNYYQANTHLHNGYSHHNDYPLKPMPQVQASRSSFVSYAGSEAYKPLVHDPEVNQLVVADQRLKNRIRILRLVSRVAALVLSLATLVPITMTLVKFLLTRNTYFTVDGKERTAWAQDTITWYTYMYFGISLVSFLFNLIVVVAYWCGVEKANKASTIASCWTTTVLVSHVLVWIASTAIYRYGKEPVRGKFRDLWGWTCSAAAQAIQSEIPNIDYNQYCTVQSVSFYTGLLNVFTGILTAVIYILVLLRSKSKKRSQKMLAKHQSSTEPLRF